MLIHVMLVRHTNAFADTADTDTDTADEFVKSQDTTSYSKPPLLCVENSKNIPCGTAH